MKMFNCYDIFKDESAKNIHKEPQEKSTNLIAFELRKNVNNVIISFYRFLVTNIVVNELMKLGNSSKY